MKKRILLVEDQHGMVVALTDRLTKSGYAVVAAKTGPEGLRLGLSQPFDVILLDILLPGMDGLAVCRELRRASIATPILMLTALGDVVDKVVGLRTGADDYLTKPFQMVELLARVEALHRRSNRLHKSPQVREAALDSYRFGDVEVFFREVEVRRGGETIHLTARMFELLRFFIQRRGDVLSRNEILDAVWHPDSMPAQRTVDVHVAWLRQRLEVSPSRPQYLLTVRGFGYRFVG